MRYTKQVAVVRLTGIQRTGVVLSVVDSKGESYTFHLGKKDVLCISHDVSVDTAGRDSISLRAWHTLLDLIGFKEP